MSISDSRMRSCSNAFGLAMQGWSQICRCRQIFMGTEWGSPTHNFGRSQAVQLHAYLNTAATCIPGWCSCMQLHAYLNTAATCIPGWCSCMHTWMVENWDPSTKNEIFSAMATDSRYTIMYRKRDRMREWPALPSFTKLHTPAMSQHQMQHLGARKDHVK